MQSASSTAPAFEWTTVLDPLFSGLDFVCGAGLSNRMTKLEDRQKAAGKCHYSGANPLSWELPNFLHTSPNDMQSTPPSLVAIELYGNIFRRQRRMRTAHQSG